MKTKLHKFFLSLGAWMVLAALIPARGDDAAAAVRGTDELFWVPTLEQALDMAAVTGKPIFVMGYSLVGDGSTYTKLGANYCTGVF